jgi:hypothetical protein
MPFSRQLIALAVASSMAAFAQAHTLDLAIGNDAVSLDYTTQIRKSELNLGAGVLHHKDNGDMAYASLFVADNVNKHSGVLAGLGGRYYFIDADLIDEDGTALGLGGFLNWDLPTVPNVSLRGDLYYAPDMLTFGEFESFYDFSARIQYRLIERAWIHAGYRRAEASPEEGRDQNIEEGGFVGLMIWF